MSNSVRHWCGKSLTGVLMHGEEGHFAYIQPWLLAHTDLHPLKETFRNSLYSRPQMFPHWGSTISYLIKMLVPNRLHIAPVKRPNLPQLVQTIALAKFCPYASLQPIGYMLYWFRLNLPLKIPHKFAPAHRWLIN